MRKKVSNFFEGYQAHYEVDDRGRRKKVLTYLGPHYGIQKTASLGLLRLLTAADTVLLIALLLLIQLFPGTGGMLPWVGMPCMWALVPALFLWIGLFNLLTCGEQWKIRQYYAGYRRVRRSARGLTFLMGWVTAAHAVTLIYFPELFPGELYYTAGALLTTLLGAGLLLLQRKHPAVVVKGTSIR